MVEHLAAQSFAYHAHGTAVTNPAVIVVCHDKTLNQQCMLSQAHPPMINHLTSTRAMWNIVGRV